MITKRSLKISICLAFIYLFGMFVYMIPNIHRWEADNGYPYGKLCASIFTLYENRCDLGKFK